MVVGLDLLCDALAECFLQGIFAARVQHLLLDRRRIRAPVDDRITSEVLGR